MFSMLKSVLRKFNDIDGIRELNLVIRMKRFIRITFITIFSRFKVHTQVSIKNLKWRINAKFVYQNIFTALLDHRYTNC